MWNVHCRLGTTLAICSLRYFGRTQLWCSHRGWLNTHVHAENHDNNSAIFSSDELARF